MARIPKLDAAGKFLAADVNAQIDARAKAATAPLLEGKRGVEATELGTEHLDTVTTPGTYTQSANLEATLENGYPMTRGGVLQVERSVSKTMVWQTYTTYAPSPSTPAQTWQRGSYNGTWTPWARVGGGGVDGSVPIFPTLAEAQAWEAANPGKKAFYVADPVTGEDTSGVVPDSDTTGPTGATVAVSGVSASGYTVTVSGAVDVETGLHATAPYAFSKDGGATWTAWQASPSYSVTGLEASTTYPAPKVKVRNQSSTPDESVFTAPAGVTTKSGVTFQAAVADPPATFAWNMDEATGATAFAQTGTDTTAGALPVRSGVTAGARAGLAGYSKAPDITAGAGMSAPIKRASIDGVKGLTLMAVAQIDGGTPYGAEMIPSGFAALSFTNFNKITGWVNIGEYANTGRFTVTADLPQFTSWSAVSAAGTHVVHLRWSANPDELSIWHQGKKVGSTTYATAVTGAGKTWPNVTFNPWEPTLSVGGSFDGAINGVRAWTNQALSDAEILQHAQSAGVA